MKTLKEALITKKNMGSVKISRHTTYKKSMLKTGDLVVFECGNVGIFCKYADVNARRYGLANTGDDYILIYLLSGGIKLISMSYSEDLRSKVTKGLNIIKVVPGVFDAVDMRNVEKINRFFTTEEYKKYL